MNLEKDSRQRKDLDENKFIPELYNLAETCDEDEFPTKAFRLLETIIDFDYAGWGEVANTERSHFMLRTKVYKVSNQWVVDYNEVDHLNPLMHLVHQNPSITINVDVDDDTYVYHKQFKDVLNKYDIFKLLTTLTPHENRLFLTSISLWRSKHAPQFNEAERQLKQRLTPHLIESYRLCRRFSVQRKLFKKWELNFGMATCNTDGILFDTDQGFVDALSTDWPEWTTATLPSELTTALASQQYYKSGSSLYRSTLIDSDMFLLVASALNKLAHLTEREFEIAYLFSSGSDYKQIADRLAISPSTVRNHLTSIYTKLDVDSKNKLIGQFNFA